MKHTTKATAPSPGHPLQSSLSGGQGGAKNLPVRSSDNLITTDTATGLSTGHSKEPCGPEVPQTSNPHQAPKPGANNQRVSKQNNSNYARPRETNFDQLFRPRNFTRFFNVKSTGESNIAKLNMFKVDKEITQKIGKYEKLSEDFHNKSWTIEVKTENQGNELLKMTTLLLSLIHI